jgi:hypothetical protein
MQPDYRVEAQKVLGQALQGRARNKNDWLEIVLLLLRLGLQEFKRAIAGD